MKVEHRVFAVAVAAGLCVWLADGVLDALVFRDRTLLDALILDVPVRDVYVRSVGVVSFVVWGLVAAAYAAKHRRAEDALRQRRRDLKAILQATENLSLITVKPAGTESVITDVSPGTERIFGYRREELVGRPLAMLHRPEDAQWFPRVIETMERTRMGLSQETVLVGKGGREFPALLSVHPLFDAQGRLGSVLGVCIDITHRKEVADALRQYQRAVESSPEMIAGVDRNYTYMLVNKAFLDYHGLEREEVIGHTVPEVVGQELFETLIRPQVDRCLQGRNVRYEMTHRRGVGRVNHLEFSYFPLWTDGPEPVGLVAIVRDVTERKEAEEALRRRNEELVALSTVAEAVLRAVDLKEILSAALEATMKALRADGGIVYLYSESSDSFELAVHRSSISPRAIREASRFRPGQGVSGTAARTGEVTIAQDLAQEPATIAPTAAREGAHAVVAVPVKVQGRVVAVMTLGSRRQGHFTQEHVPLLNRIANQIGVALENARLYQQAKCRERELREERDFVTSLVETAQVMAVVLDRRGRVLRFNRFAEELTGYSAEQVLGTDWFETFLPTGQRERARRVFQDILAGRVERGVENFIVTRDGRELLIRWYNSALTDETGNVIAVLATGHDITEIRQTEQRLRQAAKMEAIGRLAGGIAHDFNNMLAIIQGYADLLAKSLGQGHPAWDDVERIRTAARRAAGLTRQLLALGRRRVMQLQVVQLNDILAEMEPMLRSTLAEDIDFTVNPGEGLWHIKADPVQVEEVLLNLVVNARQAMPNGGRLAIETYNVTLGQEYTATRPEVAPGDYVVLAVMDTGVGIAADDQAHIFEPFFTTKAGMGTGLGLAVCYGIVTQSGGHIDVRSVPGQGTTFWVYLPRTTERPVPEPDAGQRHAQPQKLPRGTETVLVAEDEEDVRQLIVRVLRSCGYTVLETGSAREAIPLGEHYDGEIHLLLSDVVMPEMSGVELARRLARARPEMKVLYVSGYSSDVTANRSGLEEGTYFLAKPFSPAHLARTVREVLEGRAPARPAPADGAEGVRREGQGA